MINLIRVKRTDPELNLDMLAHYSRPEGFVGRNICYEIRVRGTRYGSIVGGSCTKFLPGRDRFIDGSGLAFSWNGVVNNLFFHVEKVGGRYPKRNFTQNVLAEFRKRIAEDWAEKYGDRVIFFEALVELPRTGECYMRDGWVEVGLTKGFTCKRAGGKGTDNWSGRRVWDIDNLRPKRVFMRRAK